MNALIACCLIAIGAPIRAEESTELTCSPNRAPVELLILTPTQHIGHASTSFLISVLSALFDAHTDLEARFLDAPSIIDCAGDVACIHARVIGQAPSPYMLLISNLTSEGSVDRLTLLLVDGDGAVRARPEAALVESEAEARAYLERAFEGAIRSELERTGHWDPYRTLEIALDRRAIGIAVDGASIGAAPKGRTRIRRLSAGEHTIAIALEGGPSIERKVTVSSTGATSLALESPKPDAQGPSSRDVVTLSGVGVGIAGIVITAIAIARRSSDVSNTCLYLSDPSPCPSGPQFERSGYSPGNAPSFSDTVNGRGVLLAPLGYSLIATGAVWSLVPLITEDDREIPWLALIAGIGLGVLAYGLSAALDRKSAF